MQQTTWEDPAVYPREHGGSRSSEMGAQPSQRSVHCGALGLPMQQQMLPTLLNQQPQSQTALAVQFLLEEFKQQCRYNKIVS